MSLGEKTKLLWQNPEYRERMSAAHKGINKGVKKPPRTLEHKKNLSLGHLGQKSWNKGGVNLKIRGENHYLWKGSEVGYGALHSWIYRQLGKPTFCSHCKSKDARKFEWANKSGQYKRELDDWVRLCTSCHRLFDNKRKKHES